MLHNSIQRWTLKLSLLSLLGLLSLGARSALAQDAATTETTSTSFPIDITVFVPCANGGAGEVVELSGELHDLFHITSDSSGGLHVVIHENPQDVSGVGLSTGDKYQAVGAFDEEFNTQVGNEQTVESIFQVIGQGPGNNLLVHENLHITVDANGNVTVSRDNFSAECK